MFGFSMIQMVRSNADKLDLTLRQTMVGLYTPFKWTPCILHSTLEGFLKKTKKFPVVVEFNGSCAFDEAVKGSHMEANNHIRSKMKRQIPSTSCCSMDVTPAALEELLTSCLFIKKIYYDRQVKALLDVATSSVRANNSNLDAGMSGNGVTIAVIDTGIYPHQDLAGRIVAFKDLVNDRTEPYDDNGHGTHCAGDAAGDGAASDGQYRGPAPEANLVGVKVLDKLGSGSLSTVMAGVEWCIEYNRLNSDNPIHILSMSLGSDPQSPSENDDPMVRSVEAAWNSGMVVCVAAGNSGPDPGTIASPGVSETVITVGAMDDFNTPNIIDDKIATFSSRGPTAYGKSKPDVVAPGVNIISLRSPNSYLDKLQKGNRIGSEYFSLSGTSMATPICAGVAALIIENNPGIPPNEVKRRILEGAEPLGTAETYGKGYLNAEKALSIE
ncbi:S8 family peptidase [Mesobacillus subterraneus]|uniref:Serine protease n=1 Tax=Mesobacillus subterraneus TaxID=285983 RepID=A0A3R9DP16_9BACI|nr:S8 family peptidase [Mesobacillus subterraneus]RSD23046.1 serine protease [Mesobacillus subterraneus]